MRCRTRRSAVSIACAPGSLVGARPRSIRSSTSTEIAQRRADTRNPVYEIAEQVERSPHGPATEPILDQTHCTKLDQLFVRSTLVRRKR